MGIVVLVYHVTIVAHWTWVVEEILSGRSTQCREFLCENYVDFLTPLWRLKLFELESIQNMRINKLAGPVTSITFEQFDPVDTAYVQSQGNLNPGVYIFIWIIFLSLYNTLLQTNVVGLLRFSGACTEIIIGKYNIFFLPFHLTLLSTFIKSIYLNSVSTFRISPGLIFPRSGEERQNKIYTPAFFAAIMKHWSHLYTKFSCVLLKIK